MNSSAVVLDGTALQVTRWSTTDAEVLAAAQAAAASGESLADWLARTLAVGARAVNAANGAVDHLRLEAAVARVEEQMAAKLNEVLARMGDTLERATHPATGDMARSAQAAVDRLAMGVQRVLSGPDALLPEAASRAVAQVTDRALSEIHRLLEQDRQHLAATVLQDRQSVAAEVAQAVSQYGVEYRDVMTELRELLAVRAVAVEARDAGPRKGLSYEQAVHEAIHEIAAAAGDGGADFVGSVTAANGTKKGDSLVTFRSLPGAAKRLVVEAKHRPSRPLSASEWAQELDAAMSAREAHVAVGLCPIEEMPGTSGVLVIDSRRLVVGWDTESTTDVLQTVYLLARLVAGQTDAVDQPEDRTDDLVRSMSAAVLQMAEILKQARASERAVAKIQALGKQLRDDLAARIEEASVAPLAAPEAA